MPYPSSMPSTMMGMGGHGNANAIGSAANSRSSSNPRSGSRDHAYMQPAVEDFDLYDYSEKVSLTAQMH